MAKFSLRSLRRLRTCHPDLQNICNKAIKVVDFTVLCGHRSPAEQFKLFKKGRKMKNGIMMVVDRNKVVTNCDGYAKKSRHNEKPSTAIDIAPYPIDWNNLYRFYYLAGVLIAIAELEGIEIEWGGNWKSFKDYPHFQLRRKS